MEITKDLSKAQAEAEDEKLIINLFKRRLGTDKEKTLETAPFQEPKWLNPRWSDFPEKLELGRIGDPRGSLGG